MVLLASRFEEQSNELVVKAGAQAGRNVADANPIDTGLSSGNWEGSIGSPHNEVQNRYYPTSSRASMNTLESKKKASGQSVFVSNPVDYVRHIINFGTKFSVPFWANRAAELGIKQALKKFKVKIGRL
jgi:hypothetical protein